MKQVSILPRFRCLFQKSGIIVALVLVMSPAPIFAGSPHDGQKLYTQYCSSCHGTTAKNRAPGVAKIRRGAGLMRTDIDIVRRIERGNRGCPSYRGIIRENDLLDIVAYLRTLY